MGQGKYRTGKQPMDCINDSTLLGKELLSPIDDGRKLPGCGGVYRIRFNERNIYPILRSNILRLIFLIATDT